MNYWSYHDTKMLELKQIYNRISKQTQNRLQEVFDTFDFTFDTLYNIADVKTKKRVNTYIEEWEEKGLLTGYFGMLTKSIYNRTRVKNSEILELLIYGAYIEEQSKLDTYEQQIMYDDANYYYQQGQQEVNNTLKNKKPISVLDMALFLALLEQPNVKGYAWKDYIQSILKYNAEQIYRQVTIDLQQQKELDITNDIYQNIIKRQGNSRLNINSNKISGDMDLTLIGINNQAKIEGIIEAVRKQLGKTKEQFKKLLAKGNDIDIKVRFIAVEDSVTTKMCSSLNDQIFSVNGINKFTRYYGNTAKELKKKKFRVKGLVLRN